MLSNKTKNKDFADKSPFDTILQLQVRRPLDIPFPAVRHQHDDLYVSRQKRLRQLQTQCPLDTPLALVSRLKKEM